MHIYIYANISVTNSSNNIHFSYLAFPKSQTRVPVKNWWSICSLDPPTMNLDLIAKTQLAATTSVPRKYPILIEKSHFILS